MAMIRFWKKLLKIPRFRLAKAADLEALHENKNGSWPSEIREYRIMCLSKIWNKGVIIDVAVVVTVRGVT